MLSNSLKFFGISALFFAVACGGSLTASLIDTDHDGLPDAEALTRSFSTGHDDLKNGEDWCPKIPGPVDNHGCPYAIEGAACPNEAGRFSENISGRLEPRAYPFGAFCQPDAADAFLQYTDRQPPKDWLLGPTPGKWKLMQEGETLSTPTLVGVHSCDHLPGATIRWTLKDGTTGTVDTSACQIYEKSCTNATSPPTGNGRCFAVLHPEIASLVGSDPNLKIIPFFPTINQDGGVHRARITANGESIPVGYLYGLYGADGICPLIGGLPRCTF